MIKTKRYACVKDIIAELVTGDITSFAITATYTENNTLHTKTITGAQFISALKFNYSYFHFVHINNVATFIDYFNHFIAANSENINRIFFALYKEYNPVENYDKISEIKNTPNKNGVDMTTKAKNLIETTMTDVAETTVIGNALLQSETTEHTHGNIGTMKATDLINDEIETRMTTNLTHAIVNMFARGEIIA